MTDSLGSRNLKLANPPNIQNGCGGSVTTNTYAVDGVGLTGGVAPPGGCSMSMDVTPLGGDTFVNIAYAYAANCPFELLEKIGHLNVPPALPPVVTKSFEPSAVTVTGTSLMTVSIRNDNPVPLSQVYFRDQFPPGLQTVIGSEVSSTCVGAQIGLTEILSISPSSVPANGACTVQVLVNVDGRGVYTNTIPAGAVTSENAPPNSDPGTATLIADHFDPPTVTSLAPSTGPASGGTSVKIAGTKFLAGVRVAFGGAAAPSVGLNSDGSLIAVTPAHGAGSVDVVVTNADAQSSTLRDAFTFVCSDPVIASNPGDETVAAGSSVHLSVSATTTPAITYQWYSGATGDTTVPVKGATSDSLDITPTATTSYWVRVTDACGSVDSTTATITVKTSRRRSARH